MTFVYGNGALRSFMAHGSQTDTSDKILHQKQIRDAATAIVLRYDCDGLEREVNTRVLMGKRSASAAFMPSKFVFPGGAVDPEDAECVLSYKGTQTCDRRLAVDAGNVAARTLRQAAARELQEETGLRLQVDALLRFAYRAITPPGNSRRFDARFFTVDAAEIQNDLEDFSDAEDELVDLQWVTLEEAFELNIPRITRLVLQKIVAQLGVTDQDAPIPFYDLRHADGGLRFIE